MLLGWALNIPSLMNVAPGWPTMAAGSALGFVVAGFALWCGATGTELDRPIVAAKGDWRHSWRRNVLRIGGLTVAIIGLLKLGEFLGGWNFGMDHLWFQEQPALVRATRISPATAVNFVLLGCALVLAGEKRFIGVFQFFTLFGGMIGWLGFSHYLYGGEPLIPYGQMALPTAGAFLGLSGGLLCLRADGGLMALLVSESLGGGMARRLVPAVVFIPILLGWLRLQGQRAGWFGTEAGVALLALANGLVFGCLIWANATLLHRTDCRRKLAEEKLLRLNADLEERVQERTAELTSANQEMESFTYSVAHDLRAPLRHIEAFSKILSEALGPATPPDTQQCLDSIRRVTNKMARLVDDLLKLARLSRLELKRQPISLGPLMDSVLKDLKSETEGRAIEWRIHSLPSLEADPLLTKQIFGILLSNAVKFSRTRPKALIEVGSLSDNNHLVFFVRDNGVGFDMAYADKLFGVFQRLHHSDQFEGTGVGLAAAERIVRRHGGRIWAEAGLDEGATFYFSLGSPQDLPVAALEGEKKGS